MEATGLGKVYGDGDIIVRQGEVGDCVYMILGGQVEVTYEKDGKEIQLTALGPGDFLGEMALLGPNIRSATARAMGEVRVLTIHKNTFLRRMHEDPSICLNMMRKMSRRIKELGDDLIRYRRDPGNDVNDKRPQILGNGFIMDIKAGQKSREDIANIMRGMECGKGFKCYKSGFHDLCHAKDIGMESFIECLESRTRECQFSFPFGLSHLCQCPLRIYVEKNFHK